MAISCLTHPHCHESLDRDTNESPFPKAKLIIENYKGTIHITGADRDQVVVDVRKIFEGSDADREMVA